MSGSKPKRGRVEDGIGTYGDEFFVEIKLHDPATGKRRTHSKAGFRTKADAKAYRDKIRVEAREGLNVKRDKVTVEQWLDKWLDPYIATNDLGGNTHDQYEWACKHIKHRIGHIKLQAVEPLTVRGLYADLLKKGGYTGRPLSPSSVRTIGVVLTAALNEAQVLRIISANPCDPVTLPSPDKGARRAKATWTPSEMTRLVRAMSRNRYGTLFALQAYTGMRRGMLLGLRWRHVNLAKGEIKLTSNRVAGRGGQMVEKPLKNDMEAVIRIDEACVALLKEWKIQQAEDRLKSTKWLDDDYVFTNRNGGPIDKSNLRDYWAQLIKAAKVPYLRPHNLRHTHATALLEAGVPAKVVAERLTHGNVRTTLQTYSHVTPKQSELAVTTFAEWLVSESENPESVRKTSGNTP
jgi:integrase